MPWSTEELMTLRQTSVIDLIDSKRVHESELSRSMFTCDTCLEAPDCEWVYHPDNLLKEEICLRKELGLADL
jgi:hypothetical protein